MSVLVGLGAVILSVILYIVSLLALFAYLTTKDSQQGTGAVSVSLGFLLAPFSG